MNEEWHPEPATPVKQNARRIIFPAATTYNRYAMDGAFLNGRDVSEHTRIHVAGLGHMSTGTAKALISSLLAAVRKADEDDRKRAAAAQEAAQAAEKGQ